MQENKMSKTEKNLVILVSVVIPLAVAILFKVKIDGVDFSFLPPIYATINGVTAICLTAALIAAKQKKIDLHSKLIKFSMLLSLIFLVCYVAYHMTSDSTAFGGEGWLKPVYYFILISHILLSVGVIPFVLVSYLHGKARRIEKHKKLVKWAMPLWMYVAVSGVLVYLFIAPYYV